MLDWVSLVVGAVIVLAVQFLAKKVLFGGSPKPISNPQPPSIVVDKSTKATPKTPKSKDKTSSSSSKKDRKSRDRPKSSRSRGDKKDRSEKGKDKRAASSKLAKHSRHQSSGGPSSSSSSTNKTGGPKPATAAGRLSAEKPATAATKVAVESRRRAISADAMGSTSSTFQFSIKTLNSASDMSKLEKAFVRGVNTTTDKHGMACFKGSEVVDWLTKNVDFGVLDTRDNSDGRKDAAALAMRLWAKGTIVSTESSWVPFKDSGEDTYRFQNESKARKKMEKDKDMMAYYSSRNASTLNMKAEPKSGWLEVKEVMLHPKARFRETWVSRWCVLHEATEQWGAGTTSEGDRTDSEEQSDLAEAARALLEDTADAPKEEGWELVLFDSIWDEEDSKLVQEMVDTRSGIKFLKREKMKMKSRSKRHFKGHSAVSWCIKRGKCADEKEAVRLMNALMEKNIVIPAKRKEMPYFENSAARYRFADMIFHGGATMSHPLVRMPLEKCAMNLTREDDFIHLSLARLDGKSFLQDISGFAVEHRVDTSAGLVLRSHKKEEKVMRDWIAAINSALLVANADEMECPVALVDEDESTQDDFSKTLRSHINRNRDPALLDDEDERMSADKESAADFVDEVYEGEMAKVKEMRLVLQSRKAEAIAAGQAYGECPAFGGVTVDWTELPDDVLLKCLRARRLNIDRAIPLMEICVPFRLQKKHANTTIADVRRQIPSVGRLMADCRDREGRPIIMLTAREYLPKKMSADDCVRACLYMFDVATEHLPDKAMVQRIGITVVADCSKVSFRQNFQASQVQPLVSGILGRYPLRIGHIIVMRTPWWFSTVWKAVKPLLPADVVSKVLITSKDEEIYEHVTRDNVPVELGGTYEFEAEAWLKERYSIEGVTYEG